MPEHSREEIEKEIYRILPNKTDGYSYNEAVKENIIQLLEKEREKGYRRGYKNALADVRLIQKTRLINENKGE